MRLVKLHRPDVWTATLRNEINRLFDSPLGQFDRSEIFNSWAPAVNLFEDKDNLVVTAELPGMRKEDIDISFHDGALTISGERKQEKKYGEGDESRSERFFGRFQRTMTLPKQIDAAAVKAAYKDGMLKVTLPKAPEAKPKQIAVTVD